MIQKAIFWIAAAISLSGCAIPQYVPLNQDNAKKIQKVDVRSVVVQDEIIAKADPSTISAATGGGLIPALIDASITRARQERLQTAMESFYAVVEDYDFRSEYWPQLRTHLQENYPLKVVKITTTPRTLASKELQQIIPNLAPNEGYLSLLTEYYFSTDLRAVSVSTMAQLWTKNAQQPVYKNRVTYQSSPLGSGGEQSALAWSENHGQVFYEKLKEGIRETLAMLSLDIDNNSLPAKPEQINIKYNFGGNSPGNKQSIQGTVIARRGDRVIIRDSIGYLYSVNH